MLADTLRTDRARLRPLVPDAPARISLRMAVRAHRDLVAHRVAAGNQLRAHLADLTAGYDPRITPRMWLAASASEPPGATLGRFLATTDNLLARARDRLARSRRTGPHGV